MLGSLGLIFERCRRRGKWIPCCAPQGNRSRVRYGFGPAYGVTGVSGVDSRPTGRHLSASKEDRAPGGPPRLRSGLHKAERREAFVPHTHVP
jgi:hypothetical protein